VLFIILSIGLDPNANSLHRLYRDRLSKAFLFDPTSIQIVRGWWPFRSCTTFALTADGAAGHLACGMADLRSNDRMKFTEIDCRRVPCHRVSAGLSSQGSKYANSRGRNADFFIFSSLYVGSRAPKYIRPEAIEAAVGELDLATAMAVSGAAASSNM